MVELTLERIETAIENLSRVPPEQISIKEQVYLQSLILNREHMLKKPVAWAERHKEAIREEHGFSANWRAVAGCLLDDPLEPESYSKEFKPLYDK